MALVVEGRRKGKVKMPNGRWVMVGMGARLHWLDKDWHLTRCCIGGAFYIPVQGVSVPKCKACLRSIYEDRRAIANEPHYD